MRLLLCFSSLTDLVGAVLARRRSTAQLVAVACLLGAAPQTLAIPVTGWVTGAKGVIAHTNDGGATPWNSQTSGVSVELPRADAVDTLNAWAVGEQGTIVHTGDGGATWVTQTNVLPALTSSDVLRGVDFIDANSGWAVGRRLGGPPIGVIARTTDGGSSWTSQTIGTDESIVDVDFHPGSTTGWLVGGEIAGSASIIRKTTDGNNWSAPVVLPAPIATGILDGVDFVDLLTGWAVGEGGKIIKTTDGGATWNAQVSGTTGSLSAVTFLDSQTGWATAILGGEILRTTDGGSNWSIVNVNPSYALRDIAFVDANNGWAVGADLTNFPISVNSVLLHSNDGGGTWTTQSTLPANLELLSGLAVVPGGVPEPGTCLLLAMGVSGIALSRMRGRSSTFVFFDPPFS
jgi:photosystem II stability/assembly factor-like uncharacterized protein